MKKNLLIFAISTFSFLFVMPTTEASNSRRHCKKTATEKCKKKMRTIRFKSKKAQVKWLKQCVRRNFLRCRINKKKFKADRAKKLKVKEL